MTEHEFSFDSLRAFCTDMQTTATTSADADAALLSVLGMTRADFLVVMGIIRGITHWMYNGEPNLLVRYLKQAPHCALAFLTSLFVSGKEQRLYYLTAEEESTLYGKVTLGTVTTRIRRNGLMNWAYRKDACLRFGRSLLGRRERFTVVQSCTTPFIFFTNRKETREKVAALVYALDLAPDHICTDRALLGKLLCQLRQLQVAMHEYSAECEVLTYGERRAACRTVAMRRGRPTA